MIPQNVSMIVRDEDGQLVERIFNKVELEHPLYTHTKDIYQVARKLLIPTQHT